jgi:hypothetical protein
VTKYSPYGAELENKDALNRYSAAQYGYAYKLPMAVASNSKYQQIGFEGFEEKKTETVNKHFGFANDKLNIVSNQSHTGKNSLKVAKGTSSIMSRNLHPTVQTIEEAKCPVKVEVPVDYFLYFDWAESYSFASSPCLKYRLAFSFWMSKGPYGTGVPGKYLYLEYYVNNNWNIYETFYTNESGFVSEEIITDNCSFSPSYKFRIAYYDDYYGSPNGIFSDELYFNHTGL